METGNIVNMDGDTCNLERPCGLGRRLLCVLYDAVILMGLLMIAGALALPVSGERVAFRDIPYTLFLLAVCFAYLGWCWTRAGQTLGMRAWRVRIVSLDGGNVGWIASAIRFLVGLLSAAAAGLGFLYALIDPDHRCWHDLASGTRLVRLD
jgi:uncharacterized RDD family membrane protein YckC